MNESLLTDYLIENNLSTYEIFKLKNIQIAGEWIMFEECSLEYYIESHKISILDVMAWMYSKIKT